MRNIIKQSFLSIITLVNVYSQVECPPCDVVANPGLEVTKYKAKWPDLKKERLSE